MTEKKLKKLKQEQQEQEIEQDKVWCTIKRVYQINQFEPLSVEFGGSTTVHTNETTSEASKRLFDEIHQEFNDIKDVMYEQESE